MTVPCSISSSSKVKTLRLASIDLSGSASASQDLATCLSHMLHLTQLTLRGVTLHETFYSTMKSMTSSAQVSMEEQFCVCVCYFLVLHIWFPIALFSPDNAGIISNILIVCTYTDVTVTPCENKTVDSRIYQYTFMHVSQETKQTCILLLCLCHCEPKPANCSDFIWIFRFLDFSWNEGAFFLSALLFLWISCYMKIYKLMSVQIFNQFSVLCSDFGDFSVGRYGPRFMKVAMIAISAGMATFFIISQSGRRITPVVGSRCSST